MKKALIAFLLILVAVLPLAACAKTDKASYFVIGDTAYGRTLLEITEEGARQPVLTIPNGVECIGKNAFLPAMLSLVEVNIPDSVTKIDEGAFANCINLERVNFGEESKLEVIENGAFSTCVSLKYVEIPTITMLGTNVFSGNNSIVLRFHGGTPPSQRDTLISVKALIVPDAAVEAYEEIYSMDCYQESDITEGKSIVSEDEDGVKTLELYFGADKTLTTSVADRIGEKAFRDNDVLATLTISEGTEKVASGAFSGCDNLRTVNVAKSVTSLSGFADCRLLTTVNLPADGELEQIDDNAFRNCRLLTTITIPESVTTIGNYAFYQCIGLVSVTLPTQLETLGNYLFSSRTELANLTWSDNLTVIGDYAFWGCAKLSGDVMITGTDLLIGRQAFENCMAITAIKIEADNITIGERSFNNCVLLEAVVIQGDVNEIGFRAFGVDDYLIDVGRALKTVLIDGDIGTIGSSAFSNNTVLATFKAGNIGTIDNSAFAKCKGLKTFKAGNIYMIRYNAFSDCVKLETFEVGDIMMIGDGAFSSCVALQVIIGSVTGTIGKGAFADCAMLRAISLTERLAVIQDYAFEGCTSLSAITIPASVEMVGAFCFGGCTITVTVMGSTDYWDYRWNGGNVTVVQG